MSNIETELQVKKLEYSDNLDEYNLYRAALEWDLIHPIVIENPNDLKSEYLWRDKLKPFHHQIKNLITFCRRLPVTLLADDVWLWKTISAWLIVSELASRGRISKVLIVCPKILMTQWQDELDTKFWIPSIIKTGQGLINAKIPEWIGAVITTYNSARIHLDKLVDSNYDMLILDEAHKLRNLFGTDTPPQVAKRFQKSLEDRMFKYVLMLTATPIQNRLWDLYSLVDLLTVARGHANPFGTPGLFAKKYIADSHSDARKLKESSQEEFRSVVYWYMSRIRRWDANLHFPDRIVQMHNVEPTPQEIELISVATKSIEKLNRLVQIGILQSLVSSPEALVWRLENMVHNKTITETFMLEVKEVAKRIPITTKLKGLGVLINDLRSERPQDWRVVIFTRFLHTQTSIQSFLNDQKIACGVINGKTSSNNKETIAKFSKEHPEINVIISTEAGSEGVNLQVANVLVNYDLPWNPMIVEQRIGRIQRLGSNHDKVCIFNIVLQGTFESYIVWRLMEKLQMASHAIWDIESLLQGSGTDDNEENRFEENILQLVLASLAGKDVEIATQKINNSIEEARIQLEQEEKNIDAMLGSMDENSDKGPECPKLPLQTNTIDAQNFVLLALKYIGAIITKQSETKYLSEFWGRKELIRFDNDWISRENFTTSTLYVPGSPAFDKLVAKITAKSLHKIEDDEANILIKVDKIAKDWVESFGWNYISSSKIDVCRSFIGTALIRVRATVAHDSYERLTEVFCNPNEHFNNEWLEALNPISKTIVNPTSLGLTNNELIEKSKLDPWIVEFCRFYSSRLEYELRETWNDERKRKKIEDDFTARLWFALLWLEWKIQRQLKVKITYKFENSESVYENIVTIIPSKDEILNLPNMSECQYTKIIVPFECLNICEISWLKVLNHLLLKSELSWRKALKEYIIKCSITNKSVLTDEVGTSSITWNLVIKTLLKKSALSSKIAESSFFDICEFTNTEVFNEELSVSQISGKKYRIDEELKSEVSGKKGHKKEFIYCFKTNQPLIQAEAELCEVTWKYVMPGILETCEVSGKKVLPSELEKCAISGKNALKKYIISSSISWARLLEEESIKSVTWLFCAPQEAKTCLWSWRKCHPVDLRICNLTWLTFHFEYMTSEIPVKFLSIFGLLNWINRKAEKSELWEKVKLNAITVLNNKNIKVESSELSLDGNHLAVSIEIRSLLGLKVRHGGVIYSILDNNILGRITTWKRDQRGWIED